MASVLSHSPSCTITIADRYSNIMLQAATCPDINKKFMTLLVGREEVPFTWFRQVLAFHSSFFEGAMKHSWSSESETGIIKMPEDSPDVVRE
jgi:hypothetical protein